MIDWIDLVEFDGRQYVTGPQFASTPSASVAVAAGRVGAKIGLTRCHIAGSTAGSQYAFRDGDATFLPVGTGIHAIRGVAISTGICVYRDGRWLYYKALN